MIKKQILKNYFRDKLNFFNLDEKSVKMIKLFCKNIKSDILHLEISYSKDFEMLPTHEKTIKPGLYCCGPFVFYISVEADTRKVTDELQRLAAELENSKLYRKLAAIDNYTHRKL